MNSPPDFDVIIAGAGAAGMMAAIGAAERGRRALLLEKNTKAGVKILISGGTRCNVTQNTDARGIVAAYGDQGRFLHSALARLDPSGVVKFFADEGVATKVEETNKIFPVSDSAVDVRDALVRRMMRAGAELALAEPLLSVERDGEGFIITTPRRRATCGKLILTIGGQSYSGCGTTGDGYALAAQFGHTIVPPRPALVPLTTHEYWVHALSGLTLPDTRVSIRLSPRAPAGIEMPATAVRFAKNLKSKKLPLAEARGSLLFTHFGFSGPVILDVSRTVTLPQQQASWFDLELDFLPDEKLEHIEQQRLAPTAETGKRQLATVLAAIVPQRLAYALLEQLKLSPEHRFAEVSKGDRRRIAESLKAARVPLSGTLGFKKAEVTAGGVSLAEVDSHTMESKLAPHLYFAGEILDLDGPIGGYNFQAAFSTGLLAGESV